MRGLRRALWATLLAASLLPRAAYAAPSEAEVSRAKELFDAGAREYEAGRFDNAIQAFEQAYKIAPRDGIMFSTAQAHRREFTKTGKRKNLAKAVELYKLYVEKVKSGGRVTDAFKALGEIEPQLAALAPVDAAAEPAAPAAPPKTRIVVNIVVPGTMVSIDGGAPKPAPVNEEIAPGKHKVTLSAPGYFDEEREILVEAGDIAPANLPQREKPALLSFNADAGAEISVDGRFVGEAPLQRPIELASGRHFVAVLKNGHETLTKDITLERGTKQSFQADLASTMQRDASLVVLGGSAGLGGIAIVFAGLAIERDQSAASLLDAQKERELSQTEVDDYEDARRSRNLYTGLGIGFGAGAAAFTLLGVGLHVFDKPRPIAAPILEAPKPSPATVPDEPSDIEAPSVSRTPTVPARSFSARLSPQPGGAALRLEF